MIKKMCQSCGKILNRENKGTLGTAPIKWDTKNSKQAEPANSWQKNILRLVVKKSPTGESTHYFFFMLK